MNNMMKAVVYYAPKDMRVETIPVPSCGEQEIRVKVDACAVCGTDLKSYHVGNPRIKAPLVSGHEFTGLVETIGRQVKEFALGDRIVMATSVSCGECYYCRQGWRNLCQNVAPMGFSYPGGMAEFVTIPERALKNGHVIKVPAHVKAEHAALAEPVSCTVNAMENCNVRPGDTVVVIGAGPMGILNACVAKGVGAQKILLAEVNLQRLKQAEPFGFDRLVNPAVENLTQIVLDATGGIGADVVIVAAPAAQPQEEALGMARKRGTVCLFASLPVGKNMLSLDSRKIHYGELRVVGTSDSTPAQVEKSVELIAHNKIPAAKIASHILPLDGIFKAFELMQSGEALRVVLKP
jgi:L-iditol 2-dehydrogenase